MWLPVHWVLSGNTIQHGFPFSQTLLSVVPVNANTWCTIQNISKLYSTLATRVQRPNICRSDNVRQTTSDIFQWEQIRFSIYNDSMFYNADISRIRKRYQGPLKNICVWQTKLRRPFWSLLYSLLMCWIAHQVFAPNSTTHRNVWDKEGKRAG